MGANRTCVQFPAGDILKFALDMHESYHAVDVEPGVGAHVPLNESFLRTRIHVYFLYMTETSMKSA
jgi:hypothetical protein